MLLFKVLSFVRKNNYGIHSVCFADIYLCTKYFYVICTLTFIIEEILMFFHVEK